MSKSMVKLIDIIVRSRLNVLVAGGTGAGKTTLLNAMSLVFHLKNASHH